MLTAGISQELIYGPGFLAPGPGLFIN